MGAPKASKSGKPKKTAAHPANSPNGGAGLQRLEQIVALMSRHELAELEWEKDGERIRLKSSAAFQAGYAQVAASTQILPAQQQPSTQASAPAPAAAPAPKGKQVVSPFVGTFYRSPKPDSDPYVRDGQMVKRGDVLCIIEAMKLMNEIEAEFAGKVISCLVENGQAVEFGEPLYLIEPA